MLVLSVIVVGLTKILGNISKPNYNVDLLLHTLRWRLLSSLHRRDLVNLDEDEINYIA